MAFFAVGARQGPVLASSTLADKAGVQGIMLSGGSPADSPSSVVSLSDLLGFLRSLSKGSILHFKYYNGFYQDTLQQKHFILSWDPIETDFGPIVFAISENMAELTLSSPGGLGDWRVRWRKTEISYPEALGHVCAASFYLLLHLFYTFGTYLNVAQ